MSGRVRRMIWGDGEGAQCDAVLWASVGKDESGNDDAVAASVWSRGDDEGFEVVLAVGDGAGQAAFSAEWSRLVVGEARPGWFERDGDAFVSDVAALKTRFDPLTHLPADFPEAARIALEDKLDEGGSHTTLLAIRSGPTADGGGRAMSSLAIGDVAMLVVGAGGVVSVVPDGLAGGAFDKTPATVNTLRPPTPALTTSAVREDQCVLICTDAVAEWVIGMANAGGWPHAAAAVYECLAADASLNDLAALARAHADVGTVIRDVAVDDLTAACYLPGVAGSTLDDVRRVLRIRLGCGSPDDGSDEGVVHVGGSATPTRFRLLGWFRRGKSL